MEELFRKAPSAYGFPFIMLDRVESYDPVRARLTGIKCVSRNEPLLQGHFPGFPIFPGILLIECLLQTSSFLMQLDAKREIPGKNLLVESRIKHMRPVFPGETVVLESQIVAREPERCTFRVRALVGAEEVTKGQLVLRPKTAND